MTIHANSQPWDEWMRAMSLESMPVDSPPTEPSADHLSTLIARATRGCNRARAALLREVEDPCYRFCLAQLACPDQARDATQETALRLLRSLHRYRGEASMTTWALSIALNVCREHRRKWRWLPLVNANPAADPAPGPYARADLGEQRSLLMQALQRLPLRQREAVTLRYLQGLSTSETAAAMRCAEGTVKAALANGLRNLRHAWGQDSA